MTVSPAQTKALRTLAKGRSRPELRKLFALIRASSDRELLALTPSTKKKKPKRRGDPLVSELQQALKPLLAPAAEKADMLVEHLAKKHRRKLAVAPKGLADAAKQLRAKKFTDDQIRAGAKSLVANLAKLYGDRETVV
jgi:hypothetical protein